jgi:hypothetical protein
MRLAWLIVPAVLAVPAAVAGTVKLLPSNLEMPDRIGPLVYDGKPNTWPDKRLGTAYEFHAAGMKLDVYVYDAGITDIPDGASSQSVCAEFEQAKMGVMQGGYRDLVLKREQLARMGTAQEPPFAREAVYEAVMQDVPIVSYVWITGASGNFIKLRFSASQKLRDELDEARRAVLTTMGEAIGPHLAPAPAPAPAPPPAAAPPAEAKEKSETSIVINGSGMDDMVFGMLYLSSVAALADEEPALRPPCGGPVELPFEAEVGAHQSALAFAEGDSSGSKFSKKLVEVAKAGYLEEFVWTHRHRDSWGDTPPAGLDIEPFRKWAKKNLRRLEVPTFGYVEYKEPKALPVEPLP